MYKLKMFKKLAKIKYMPNNFEIIEDGDHVICAISGKNTNSKFKLLECRSSRTIFFICGSINEKRAKIINLHFPSIVSPNPLFWIFNY